jgi:hypothetical protein
VAAASSVTLLVAACNSAAKSGAQSPTPPTTAGSVSSGTSSPSPTASAAPTIQWAAGTPLISDGSATVTIGGVPVPFPTKVTDAAWSPDGSRIAFVDGDGDISTARPDGGSLVALVKPDKGSRLSSPAWDGGGLLYVEQLANGSHSLRQAYTKDQTDHTERDTYAALDNDIKELPETSAPTGSTVSDMNGVYGSVAFQHKGAKGPEIWFHATDSNERGGANPAVKDADGSWPALSATGGKIAFVGVNGQIEVVDPVRTGQAPKPVQLTTTAKSPSHLTWTADGKAIAYSTPTGIESVPDDAPGAAPTRIADKPGVVSFLPAATDQVASFAGNDPSDLIGASIALSQRKWMTQTGETAMPAGGGAHGPFGMTVTLVVADDPAAALRQASWTWRYGPVLIVGHGDLDARVTAEIKRVLGRPQPADPSGTMTVDKVFLVDPSSAIPATADAAIAQLGYTPVRVTAPDPTQVTQLPETVVADKADATGITFAKAEGCNVIVVDKGKISPADLSHLKSYGAVGVMDPAAATAVTATGNATLPPPQTFLISGSTHADFRAAMARGQHSGAVTVIPTGSPKDLLLAGLENLGPIVVVDPAQGVSPLLKSYLDEDSAQVSTLDVVDTGSRLSTDLVKQLGTLIGGPLGTGSAKNPTADAQAKVR